LRYYVFDFYSRTAGAVKEIGRNERLAGVELEIPDKLE